ncbi:YhjR family protein [Yersinia ruckeri]|uniref:cellulose biosynthesis protein BcsR n=1 Tax=Yersinia ruckeri TaxID=29486 RepID=UPI0020BEC4E2|nr:cellulose biosynthesis protein BcsR [Yersinia ruckeri]MCK8565758.1 YhjR family protein [Yersinia ruckeri]UZY18480.1 cellulose biosynthesis protein BcsR [Yersinia ruckeri]
MNTQIDRFYVNSSSEVQDDLLALSRAFALPKLSYIDIVRQERLQQMMARWPLLAELAQFTGSK